MEFLKRSAETGGWVEANIKMENIGEICMKQEIVMTLAYCIQYLNYYLMASTKKKSKNLLRNLT